MATGDDTGQDRQGKAVSEVFWWAFAFVLLVAIAILTWCVVPVLLLARVVLWFVR